jgi:hypothetical protein
VFVYAVKGALAFPLEETSDPLSATWGTRLFARLAVTTLASAGAAMGTLERTRGAMSRPVGEGHES